MLITDRQQFESMLRAIETSETIAWDTEADGLHLRHGNKTIGISVYTSSDSQTWYFAWRHGFSDVADADYEVHKRWSIKKRAAYAQHIYNEQIKPEVVAENMPVEWLDDLKAVWLKPTLHLAHNAPFDLTALSLFGFPTPPKIADTMSMLAVVNSDWKGNPAEGLIPQFRMPDTGQLETGSRGLKWASRLFGLTDAKAGIDSLEAAVEALNERLIGIDSDARLDIKKPQQYLWMLKPSDVARYAEDDVRLTYALYEKILRWGEKWRELSLMDLYNNVTLMVWQMHNGGIYFNADRAEKMIAEGEERLTALGNKIRTLSGGLIDNPASPKQVLEYLNAIGVEVDSTDKYEMRKVRDVPVVALLGEYRTLSINLNTFIKKWRENAVNGRIHLEYNVGGTSSGRLSSGSDLYGNAQNIPRMTAKSHVNPKMLLFPPEGTIWIEQDYSALEVNLGAYVSETVLGRGKDLSLTKILEDGADMHVKAMEYSDIYNVLLRGRTEEQYLRDNGYDLNELEGMTPQQYYMKKIARQTQKTSNFASAYGASAPGIIRAVGCTKDEAEAMLRGFHRAFPMMGQAMKYLEELALTPRKIFPDSTIVSEFVRYPIEGLRLTRKFGYYPTSLTTKTGGTWSPRKKAARTAFNAMVQGSGGLLVLASILRIKERFGFALDKFGNVDYTEGIVVPLGTVHDSFSYALRPQDLYIVPEITELMTDWNVRPKLKVSVSAGALNEPWGAVRDIHDIDKWIESKGMER